MLWSRIPSSPFWLVWPLQGEVDHRIFARMGQHVCERSDLACFCDIRTSSCKAVKKPLPPIMWLLLPLKRFPSASQNRRKYSSFGNTFGEKIRPFAASVAVATRDKRLLMEQTNGYSLATNLWSLALRYKATFSLAHTQENVFRIKSVTSRMGSISTTCRCAEDRYCCLLPGVLRYCMVAFSFSPESVKEIVRGPTIGKNHPTIRRSEENDDRRKIFR